MPGELTLETHVCDLKTMTYHYVKRGNFDFLHRVTCTCGRYWTCSMVPDRRELIPTGKMIGRWYGLPGKRSNFQNLAVWRRLTAVVYYYYDKDYDPTLRRQEAIKRGMERIRREGEQDEVQRVWRAFKGFAHWPEHGREPGP